eukprot:COSAG01_NODE_5776_length_4039_cov_11.750761_1_plen_21_part_10
MCVNRRACYPCTLNRRVVNAK